MKNKILLIDLDVQRRFVAGAALAGDGGRVDDEVRFGAVCIADEFDIEPTHGIV